MASKSSSQKVPPSSLAGGEDLTTNASVDGQQNNFASRPPSPRRQTSMYLVSVYSTYRAVAWTLAFSLPCALVVGKDASTTRHRQGQQPFRCAFRMGDRKTNTKTKNKNKTQPSFYQRENIRIVLPPIHICPPPPSTSNIRPWFFTRDTYKKKKDKTRHRQQRNNPNNMHLIEKRTPLVVEKESKQKSHAEKRQLWLLWRW